MTDNNYLYHYTNVETLALILKNHTIRLNSLDKMDDKQEQMTADLKNIGQFIYISSWTDEAKESIPMWNQYASIDQGVRIKLRKNPFKIYDNTVKSLSKVCKLPVIGDDSGSPLKSIIPLEEIFLNGFFSQQALSMELLYQIVYTDDKDKLYPKIVRIDETNFHIATGILGKYKSTYWKFQKEWRYILRIIPLDINQGPDQIAREFQLVTNRILRGIEKQPFSYYDMVIADDAFSEMEITLAPKVSAGTRVIVEQLVSSFNPNATVKDSDLLGLI